MTTEYGGSGDPAKSLELLWGTGRQGRRGPKPGLSVARIVEAAIALADAEGLPAMSVRRVADALGVGAMTLYRYVPGKAELVDVMVDTVYGELPYVAEPAPGDSDWRAALTRIAEQSRELYLRHPWLLHVAISRPVLGPHAIAKYDAELRAVDGIGLSDIEMDGVVTLLGGYVHGAVRGAIESAMAERQTGLTDEQWWQAHEPLLATILDPERFPVAARVGSAAGEEYNAAYAPAHAFDFGLARILDGIATLLTARR